MRYLMNKWNLKRWQDVLVILFVFSITGSTSVVIGRPFLAFVGITKEQMDPMLYYPLFVVLSFLFYQVFLVTYGWLFGQFSFFWTMEKKMLKRFGIKI